MSKLIDLLTPAVIIQGIITILIVLSFCIQEITYQRVDNDLKLITFAVIGFWLGGLATLQTQRFINGVRKTDE